MKHGVQCFIKLVISLGWWVVGGLSDVMAGWCRMVISLVYYGLSLSTATMAGDRFLNAFLSGLVEIPAYTSSFFVLQRQGPPSFK